MNNVKFIPIHIQTDTGIETRFVNLALILEVYQDQDNIVIVYTNGVTRIVPNQNIQLFMDRFKY